MSPENDTDIVVIGGGPAGSAAAITAARAGLRVTLLERARFPRHRPGETLHPGIEPLLNKLGLSTTTLNNPIRYLGAQVKWGESSRFEAFGADSNGLWLGFQTPRDELDAELLRCASQAGVRVNHELAAEHVLQKDDRVTGVETERGAIWACWTIDATGGRQWLGRQLGHKLTYRSPALTARYGYVCGSVPSLDQAPTIITDANGWTWMARVAPGRYHWTRVSRRGDEPAPDWRPKPLDALDDDAPIRGEDVTWRRAERLAGAGYFLVGDAAVQLDPASSHGVLRAIMSGMMTSYLITKAISRAALECDVIEEYERWLNAWFEHDVNKLRSLYASADLSQMCSISSNSAAIDR
ncbi:hypothetical protein Mal52_13290 [Symmachiella dynata]|uniref:FAD-binding domain-containing protein n=1 Tax=Symmachiella dynata TaxID=2527995 RepID=A0A517ZK39_9PLAN|nr:FAD-dependent oxidoreductase [Symmachiella dynata]QDU42860.1 hypothetical protein Mal52_13290 [Symmachiella dynata]